MASWESCADMESSSLACMLFSLLCWFYLSIILCILYSWSLRTSMASWESFADMESSSLACMFFSHLCCFYLRNMLSFHKLRSNKSYCTDVYWCDGHCDIMSRYQGIKELYIRIHAGWHMGIFVSISNILWNVTRVISQ